MDNIKMEFPHSEMLDYEPMVMVPREVYDALQNDSFAYNVLLNALIDNASLAWDNDKLAFSGEAINPVLRALLPDTYYSKLRALNVERERKEANGTD